MHQDNYVSDSNGIMKKLEQLEGLIKVDGEVIMGEVEVRLQPLRNFEAVREPAKTEEQKLYRTDNGVIKDIETQVYELIWKHQP